jgi:hypothetical protein
LLLILRDIERILHFSLVSIKDQTFVDDDDDDDDDGGGGDDVRQKKLFSDPRVRIDRSEYSP